MDYIFVDGNSANSVERKFVDSLEVADEVMVYAKLPKGFHIPTPVGNYSPDWAIAFEEGKVKHIYFIAETKGSMSSLELREIEKTRLLVLASCLIHYQKKVLISLMEKWTILTHC